MGDNGLIIIECESANQFKEKGVGVSAINGTIECGADYFPCFGYGE